MLSAGQHDVGHHARSAGGESIAMMEFQHPGLAAPLPVVPDERAPHSVTFDYLAFDGRWNVPGAPSSATRLRVRPALRSGLAGADVSWTHVRSPLRFLRSYGFFPSRVTVWRTCSFGACPAFRILAGEAWQTRPRGRSQPRLLQLSEKETDRAVEHFFEIAVGNDMTEQVQRASELLVGRGADRDLHPVALRRELCDVRARTRARSGPGDRIGALAPWLIEDQLLDARRRRSGHVDLLPRVLSEQV